MKNQNYLNGWKGYLRKFSFYGLYHISLHSFVEEKVFVTRSFSASIKYCIIFHLIIKNIKIQKKLHQNNLRNKIIFLYLLYFKTIRIMQILILLKINIESSDFKLF